MAPEWTLGPFVRASDGPIVRPNPASVFDCPLAGKPVHWEALHTFNPAAAVLDGRVHLLYRAEDDSGEMKVGGHTSRLGLATSEDGIQFVREPAPVFFPAADGQREREWTGGCEDPRLVATEDGGFVLTYTQYDGRGTARLAVATSRDLRTWVKHGPAFPDRDDLWSKSGSIVCERRGDQLVAVRIGGRYWMYWGEFGIALASSDDLVRWEPETEAVLPPRKGHFDSDLAEGGPAAVLGPHGIVVLYNGKNAHGDAGDPERGPGTYCAGQALFDAKDPHRLIDRPFDPYFAPAEPWERTGQYLDGTTFTEGLVAFQGRWLLYYGAADSLVGVAAAPI